MGVLSLKSGAQAEKIAVKYLQKLDYEIIDTNWKCKCGEIDIVASKDFQQIVFFEVKYRKDARFGYPVEFISASKLAKLRKAIEVFLLMHAPADISWRLDGLCLMPREGKLRLRWYECLFSDI
ncbi:YraN family protein [candidate division WWE3 bacterium]|nr:YraN family protein [candidate division WWE3 bacterium]